MATLVAALGVTSLVAAPARADNEEALAAAALFGLAAVGIIAATRDSHARAPLTVAPLKPLPASCRFDIPRGRDRGTWYARHCLVATYPHWPLLPYRCERRVVLRRQGVAVTAYSASCLVQAGYGGYGGADAWRLSPGRDGGVERGRERGGGPGDRH